MLFAYVLHIQKSFIVLTQFTSIEVFSDLEFLYLTLLLCLSQEISLLTNGSIDGSGQVEQSHFRLDGQCKSRCRIGYSFFFLNFCFFVLLQMMDGTQINVDVTAPGAIVALGLMYLKVYKDNDFM